MISMNESASTTSLAEAASDTGIFRAMFRLTAIADLYGPDCAVEWAQSLLDDPKLRMAFVRPGPPPPVTVAQKTTVQPSRRACSAVYETPATLRPPASSSVIVPPLFPS
jgi:hypothetical protein